MGPVLTLHDEVIISTETQFSGDSTQEGSIFTTETDTRANEYSIYGWAKWNTTPNKLERHALFRLTTTDEARLADDAKAGDKDLAFYVGEDNLIVSTYSFSYTSSEYGKIEQNIPYEDDLESWFWVYYGYNRAEERAYTFIRFYDRVFSE